MITKLFDKYFKRKIRKNQMVKFFICFLKKNKIFYTNYHIYDFFRKFYFYDLHNDYKTCYGEYSYKIYDNLITLNFNLLSAYLKYIDEIEIKRDKYNNDYYLINSHWYLCYSNFIRLKYNNYSTKLQKYKLLTWYTCEYDFRKFIFNIEETDKKTLLKIYKNTHILRCNFLIKMLTLCHLLKL